MDVRNKTKMPLAVPLPGGKKLRLGPGKTGQITPKAAEFAPLKKLVEEDKLEFVVTGRSSTSGPGTGGTGIYPSQGGSSSGGVRHTGDR